MNRSYVFPAVVVAVASLFLAACSGNSSSSSRAPTQTSYVNGYLGASDIRNATVYIVPADVQGQPARQEVQKGDKTETQYLGSVASTDTRAYYQGSVDKAYLGKATVFIATSKEDNKTLQVCQIKTGCDAASYGMTYSVDEEFRLVAASGTVANNTRVNINWITHLAADVAYTSYYDSDFADTDAPGAGAPTAVDGIFTPFTIERGNIWINKQFEISDIISVRPIALTEMHRTQDLASSIRSEGIYYGALVAAQQKLAADANKTQTEWLEDIVDLQRANRGQLYINHASEFSLCQAYSSAHALLDAAKNIDSPTEVNTVLARLIAKKEDFCGRLAGTLTNISVTVEEVKGWTDQFAKAKEFVIDLNKRLVNFDGKYCERTYTSGSPEFTACKAKYDISAADILACNEKYASETNLTLKNQKIDQCIQDFTPSFIPVAYVDKSSVYYQALQDLFLEIQPELYQAQTDIRTYIFDFVNCLNNKPSCVSSRYSGNSTTKIYTYTVGDLVINLKPYTVQAVGAGVYNAFDFELKGHYRNSDNLKIEFKSIETTNRTGQKVTEYARIRVVYAEAKALPPISEMDEDNDGIISADAVEPYGFDFYWPHVDITDTNTSKRFGETLSIFIATKLIGVKPILDPTKPMHYNITEMGFGLKSLSALRGTIVESGKSDVKLHDIAELTLTAKGNNAANYYSRQTWPTVDDYFRISGGAEINTTEPNLFEYKFDQKVANKLVHYFNDDGTSVNIAEADYFQFRIRGLGIERIEVFTVKGARVLRKCTVPEGDLSAADEREKVCSSTESVKQDFHIVKDLIYPEAEKPGDPKPKAILSAFAIPGHGAYRPLYHASSTYLESEWVAGRLETVAGELEANFSQGIDELTLRISQQLVNGSGSSATRAPMALIDMNLVRKTRDNWELSLAAGYDYDYLVDVLPTGVRAQSLYLSYFVRESYEEKNNVRTNFFSELGGLIIFRGGVKLFSNDEKGESVGVTLASRLRYEIGDAGTGGACGIVNRDDAHAIKCDAVAYLTYRNALVGVIREERKNVYVARFSNGEFIILGG